MIMLVHPSITCSINKSEFRKLIMAKGKASLSSSGASMSKYDVEVEARLQALEKVAHPVPTGATQQKVDDRVAALEAKLDKVIKVLHKLTDFDL